MARRRGEARGYDAELLEDLDAAAADAWWRANARARADHRDAVAQMMDLRRAGRPLSDAAPALRERFSPDDWKAVRRWFGAQPHAPVDDPRARAEVQAALAGDAATRAAFLQSSPLAHAGRLTQGGLKQVEALKQAGRDGDPAFKIQASGAKLAQAAALTRLQAHGIDPDSEAGVAVRLATWDSVQALVDRDGRLPAFKDVGAVANDEVAVQEGVQVAGLGDVGFMALAARQGGHGLGRDGGASSASADKGAALAPSGTTARSATAAPADGWSDAEETRFGSRNSGLEDDALLLRHLDRARPHDDDGMRYDPASRRLVIWDIVPTHDPLKPYKRVERPASAEETQRFVERRLGAASGVPGEQSKEEVELRRMLASPDGRQMLGEGRPVVEPVSFTAGGRLEELSMIGETSQVGDFTRAIGMVSTGVGDRGGVSYGPFQFNSTDKVVLEFLASPHGRPWAGRFAGLEPNVRGGDFAKTWKAVAREEPAAFYEAAYAFTKEKYYDRKVAYIRNETGVDLDQMPRAVKNVVWSMLVQHEYKGQAIIIKSIREAGPKPYVLAQNVFEEQFIKSLYRLRIKAYPRHVTRYDREREAALKMLHAEK